MTKGINLSVCVPARDTVNTGFAYDLARMSARWYANAPEGSAFNLHFLQGTLIADQRCKLVEMALRANADWVLFLDSDMRFPIDLVDRLLAHDKDIVACNYATRRLPVKTVAFKDWAALEHVYSLGKSGLEQVAAVGMGAMLIRADVFKKLGYPWFQIHYVPSAKMWAGEDMFFCELARRAGLDIWIDHDASQKIAHTGSLDFKHEHTEDEMIAQDAKQEAAE
jgi:GT2 family glycosyltransferase